MKHTFLFFVVLHLMYTQKCQGTYINNLHIVVVSNLVEPTDDEIQTFTYLATYPFLKATNSSLMTRLGLVVNYTIIFSDEPDDLVTLRGLDMDQYSIEYFRSLVKNHTANCKGASLKTLHRALEITTKNSIIFMASNRRPKSTTLMVEILEAMVAKLNPVIVIQMKQDGSVSALPGSYELELDVNQFIPPFIKKNNEPLTPELKAISEVSRDLLVIMVFDELMAKLYAVRIPNMLRTFPNITTNFKHSSAKRSLVFVYDVVNATENELDQISYSMDSYFHSKLALPYSVNHLYYVAFSSQPYVIFRLEKSNNYTAKDFRLMIKTRANELNKSTLDSLKRALKFIPVFSQIIYYVKNVPDDDHELLPEIVQLITDKSANISIQAYGNLSSNHLPVLYRTIRDASRLASSSPYISTTMVEGIIVLIGLIISDLMFDV